MTFQVVANGYRRGVMHAQQYRVCPSGNPESGGL